MKRFIAVIFLSLSVLPLSLGLANEAPIEHIPTDNISATPVDQVPSDHRVLSSDLQPKPSVDISPPDHSTMTAREADGSVVVSAGKDHLVRVEQQMANMISMNFPQQIEELRQEIQQLNGRLQMQQHDIKQLSRQQKAFYQDLNRRFSAAANATGTTPVSSLKTTLADVSPSNATPQDSATAYRRAFDLLMKKQYDGSIQGFIDYLHQYPSGDFAANAYYWLGELYLKQNKPVLAQDAFNSVLQKYPGSNKVPDAKLKLALIQITQGHREQARRELLHIKRQYPNSTAAQLAGIQLQRLEQ